MTDFEILQLIRQQQLEKPVRELYKTFPTTRLTLLKYGANEQNILELFNDALVVLIEKASSKEFELSSKLSTYLIGIALNNLRNALRKDAKDNRFIQFSSDLPETYFSLHNEFDAEKEEKLTIIDSILTNIQERCQQLLKLFYFEKKSMDEIAQIMQFSSSQSAKTQKYKCLEKAHQMANEQLFTSKKLVQ